MPQHDAVPPEVERYARIASAGTKAFIVGILITLGFAVFRQKFSEGGALPNGLEIHLIIIALTLGARAVSKAANSKVEKLGYERWGGQIRKLFPTESVASRARAYYN